MLNVDYEHFLLVELNFHFFKKAVQTSKTISFTFANHLEEKFSWGLSLSKAWLKRDLSVLKRNDDDISCIGSLSTSFWAQLTSPEISKIQLAGQNR